MMHGLRKPYNQPEVSSNSSIWQQQQQTHEYYQFQRQLMQTII